MKHISIVLAALVLVLVLGTHAITKADPPAAAPAGVQKWEYMRVWFSDADEGVMREPAAVDLRAQHARCDKNKDGVLRLADGPDWGGIGADEGSSAMMARPRHIAASPVTIFLFAPKRVTSRALKGVTSKPVIIMGRNTSPVENADKPRCPCKYKLITNGNP